MVTPTTTTINYQNNKPHTHEKDVRVPLARWDDIQKGDVCNLLRINVYRLHS
jgi:hypothetical protein